MTSGLIFGVMLALRAWLQWIGPLPVDHFALDHYGARWLPPAMISLFAGTDFVVLVAATMVIGTAISMHLGGYDTAAGFVLSAFVVVWNKLLKMTMGPVPSWAHGRAGVDFPSGHQSWTTAAFGYLAWIALERRRYWLAGACLMMIVATAVERVLSGAHTISDVIGGALLAAAWITAIMGFTHGLGTAHALFRRLGAPCALSRSNTGRPHLRPMRRSALADVKMSTATSAKADRSPD